MDKILCVFGASITYGSGDPEKGGWANRLRLFLESGNHDVDFIYNLGIPGNNAGDLLKRFEKEAEARKPDVIIFSIGINDSACNEKGQQKVSINEFEENLNKLVKKSEKFAEKTIFTGLTRADESKTMPVSWNTDYYYSNKNIIKYDSAIQKICQKNKLLFIDMLDLLGKKDLADGLHPNSKGHEKIFQKIKQVLVKNRII